MSSQPYQTDLEKLLNDMKKEAEEMVEEKLSAFYGRGVPMVNVWMAVSFFGKMKYHEVSFTSPWTIMYLACLVVSAVTDTEINMMFVTRHSRGRWMMAYLSSTLQISAATALILFFNTTDTVIVFLLFGLVLVLVIYLFCQMLGPGKVPAGWLMWLDFREFLDRGFEMSALVVAPSVAGLSGKVLGYVKGSSSNLTTAVAPEFFLFCSAVSGLLVVLFCTVPPSLTDVERMAKVYIPGIAYAALLFLVVATVVAAEKILQEYVYLVCCPIAIFALLLCLCDGESGSSSSGRQTTDHRPAQRRRSLNDVSQDYDEEAATTSSPAPSSLDEGRKDEAKLSKYLFTAGISPILLAVMAIHSRYGIGSGSTVSLSWSWKAFVSLAVCSILSHTVRIFILDQMTEIKRYKISRKFWTAWTCAVTTITAVLAVLVTYLHPDEVKDILL